MKIILPLLILFSSSVFAAKSDADLIRDFNKISTRLEKIYKEDVERITGKDLSVGHKWGRKYKKAYGMVSQKDTFYDVIATEGLIRYFANDPDPIAMTLCHEIGHIIGGAPHKVIKVKKLFHSSKEVKKSTMAEGQSDYFATAKCLKRYFESDNNQELVEGMSFPQKIKDACRQSYDRDNDYYICLRTVKAIESVATFRATKTGVKGNILTPDKSIVKKTNTVGYPMSQCRVDTYWQGAICNVDPYIDADNEDSTVGYCNATTYSRVGARPRCWFKE